MKENLVELRGVSMQINSQTVLHDIWIAIGVGQTVGIAGINHSGRTLVARLLSGMASTDNGQVLLNDFSISDRREVAVRLRTMSRYLGRQNLCFDELSISENLLLLRRGPLLRFFSHRDIVQANLELRESCVSIDPALPIGVLSPEDRIYCEVLLSLLTDARMIILDEKIDVLYRRAPERVRELIQMGKEKRKAFVIIGADIDLLLDLSDELMVVRNGASIMQCVRRECSRKTVIRMMTGKNLPAKPGVTPRKLTSERQEVLRIDDLCLTKTDVPINCCTYRGVITGLLSLDKGWHQELMRIFLSQQKPERGILRLNGKALTQQSFRHLSNNKNRLCILPNLPWRELLFPYMSVEENLLLTAMPKITIGPLGVIGRNVPRFARRYQIDNKALSSYHAIDELDDAGCMQLVMNRIRIYNPDLLIIWEPTETTDPNLRNLIFQECRLCAERNISVLILSANIQDLLLICDQMNLCRDRQIQECIWLTGTETAEELAEKL